MDIPVLTIDLTCKIETYKNISKALMGIEFLFNGVTTDSFSKLSYCLIKGIFYLPTNSEFPINFYLPLKINPHPYPSFCEAKSTKL